MNQESFYWLVRQELPSHLLTCLLPRPCRQQLQREAWLHYLPVKLSLTFLCHVYYYVHINVYYPQHNFIYLYLSHSPQSSQHPLTSTPLHSHKYNLLCLTLDTKTFSQSPVRGCLVFLNTMVSFFWPRTNTSPESLSCISLSFIRSQVYRCHCFCVLSNIWEIRWADRWLMTNFSSSSRSGWAH